MITDEERKSIIDEAVEKSLLALPEVVSNLIMSQLNLVRLNVDFYKKYPMFQKMKDIVREVVEKVEGENVGMDYEELLKKAVPIIERQMDTVTDADFQSVERPNRRLDKLQLNNPADHGEL